MVAWEGRHHILERMAVTCCGSALSGKVMARVDDVGELGEPRNSRQRNASRMDLWITTHWNFMNPRARCRGTTECAHGSGLHDEKNVNPSG